MHAHPQTRPHWWHRLRRRRAAALLLVVGGALGAALVAAAVSLLAAVPKAARAPAQAAPMTSTKNIVLVHGAWVDGSGWKPVDAILVRDGYHVSIVQEPLTSLQSDVATTRRIIALQPGPCILVAHSYGGTVITEAGTDPHVVGLVIGPIGPISAWISRA